MEQVPSHWPPPEGEESIKREYPLFLLPRVLVPYTLLELMIFEPRYIQMMEDVLDQQGRIVIGTALEGEDLSGSPAFHPIAGLGEIGRHDQLEDGRYRIVLVGLRRVVASEAESERLYRKVLVEEAAEIPVPREREQALRKELMAAIRERTQPEVTIPAKVPTSSLADLLMLRMPLSDRARTALYSELDTEKRARVALAHHAVLPKTQTDAQDSTSFGIDLDDE